MIIEKNPNMIHAQKLMNQKSDIILGKDDGESWHIRVRENPQLENEIFRLEDEIEQALLKAHQNNEDLADYELGRFYNRSFFLRNNLDHESNYLKAYFYFSEFLHSQNSDELKVSRAKRSIDKLKKKIVEQNNFQGNKCFIN